MRDTSGLYTQTFDRPTSYIGNLIHTTQLHISQNIRSRKILVRKNKRYSKRTHIGKIIRLFYKLLPMFVTEAARVGR